MNNNILKGIGFENFRVFKQQTLLDFAPLTVLTGTNSSGKSSVINGLKLIGESFSDIKSSKNPLNIELESLFKYELNVNEMLKRYGTLDKYINNDVKDLGLNQFTFTIPSKLKKIGANVVVNYRVQIEENEQKSGRLNAIEIIHRKDIRTLFKIEKCIEEANGGGRSFFEEDGQLGIKEEEFVLGEHGQGKIELYNIKIDLLFFYEAFKEHMDIRRDFFLGLNRIVNEKDRVSESEISNMKKDLDLSYKEYQRIIKNYNYGFISTIEGYNIPVDEDELFDRLFAISDLLHNGMFYDFTFLWAENKEDEKLFEMAMKKFYGEYSAESKKNLCTDILTELSTIGRKPESIRFFIYFNGKKKQKMRETDIFGLSLLDTALRLFGKSSDRNVPGAFTKLPFGRTGKSEYTQMSVEKINELTDKNDFLVYLFNMIANKESFYDKGIFSKSLKSFLTPQERKLTTIKSYEISDAEEYFYEEFIFPNLGLLKEVFIPFQTMESVSAERSSTKGIKSILDSDDFSRLMKKRFSATGLKKDAFNELDRFLNRWLKEFKIAEEIKFEKDEDYDVFKVKLLKNGNWMMLSDEGFGVSQVLPVILSCCPIISWNYEIDPYDPFKENNPKLVLIEEPETNLHPALQSKLADMFMDAVKTFNIRFVIETHSEYFIRKLQYLTGKGDIKPEQTVIYYFYPPTEVPEGEKQVKKINIQQDGSLTDDFGTGFFDEADNIALELFLLKQSQKN